MLIHVRHAVQKELVPDRLVFRFDAALDARLGPFSRWMRRKPAEGGPPGAILIQNGDRLLFQLPPAAGPVSFRLPPVAGGQCRVMISPMGSLDRQWQSALSMTPRFSDDGTHIVYTELWVGRRRLLYISPESLISRTFREDLNRIIKGARPASLIIDEAHAISEWGGAFRSAYQRIPRMIEDLRRHNPDLSVLAVTPATGKWVARDIQGMLGLDDRSPMLRRDVYQTDVSHQAAVVGSPEEKEAVYEQLLWRDIPALLEREGFAETARSTYPQYRDPYLLPLGGVSGDRGNPTDVPLTERRFRDSGNPHILIHTAMGDSLTDWLHRLSQSEGRRHCIRLAELPTDACEADLGRRRSRIPQCRGQVCAHGRPSLCDYGKQHHLIRQSHPDPRRTFVETFRVLDRLLASIDAGEAPARVSVPENDGGRTERALYRLSLLGVIEIFFIDYRTTPPEFNAYGCTTTISPETTALRVLRYLLAHDISHKTASDGPDEPSGVRMSPTSPEDADADGGPHRKTDAWLERAHAEEAFSAYERHRTLFHRLAAYLPPMLCHVPENLEAMRYRRLWHLKSYMRSTECRYAALVRHVRAVGSRWHCRACDRCCADLVFESAPPGEGEASAAAEAFLSTWLEADDVRFDRDAAEALLAPHVDLAGDMTARAEMLLEDDPRNLKALFLLARFSGGAEQARSERDLEAVREKDLRVVRLIRLCERYPGGHAVAEAMSEMAPDPPAESSPDAGEGEANGPEGPRHGAFFGVEGMGSSGSES